MLNALLQWQFTVLKFSLFAVFKCRSLLIPCFHKFAFHILIFAFLKNTGVFFIFLNV